MRSSTNKPREIATERTPPLQVSLSSSGEWEVTSSATHKNDTFSDAEGIKAVMKASTNQSNTRVMSSSKTQKDINILSQTYPPSDKTQSFTTLPNHSTLKEAHKDPDTLPHNDYSDTTPNATNFLPHTYASSEKAHKVTNVPSHAYSSSDNIPTPINVLYNDLVNDHQNEISDNREGYTFEARHKIILNIIIMIAAVVAASRLALSWLRHRRRRRLNQRQVGPRMGCLGTASSKKWAEAYV